MDFGNSLGNLAAPFLLSTPPNLPLQRGGIIISALFARTIYATINLKLGVGKIEDPIE